MKKFLSLFVVAVLTSLTLSAQSDQFVSTTPSNKNVVLEEDTGINCGYCPDGHRIANEIAAQNPGRVSIINVHVGSYAANTYTTQFGNALANQTGLTGYPAGTVNRHVYPDLLSPGETGTHTVTDLSRGNWNTAAGRVLAESSPVNIAAQGTLDWTTRELSLTVQLYYTADEANPTNMLNVAIVQDNVLGSQSGASFNPSQQVGSQYRHMHMLRHLITGQWGEEITTTTQGSFVEKTYTYTIPSSLGSPNAILAKLEDLHFICFVAQGHQEILTGCQAQITNVNMPAINPRVDALKYTPVLDCSTDANISATVSNMGSEPLTSLTFQYTVANGTPQTFNWTGNIPSEQNAEIELPTLTINPNMNQSIKVKIISANGTNFVSDEVSTTIKKVSVWGAGEMTLKIKTDSYASETSYKIYGPNGNVVQQSSSFTNSSVNEFTFNPSEMGCYRIQVKDSYGDGISNGYIRLYDAANTLLFNIGGATFSTEANAMVHVTPVSVQDYDKDEEIVVYPNPATDVLHIDGNNIQNVAVYNLQGQCVLTESGNVNELSISNLARGMYLLKVTTDNGVRSIKISKN